MKQYLLVDFGATGVKCAVSTRESAEFVEVKSFPALKNVSTKADHYEISTAELTSQFKTIIHHYREFNLSGILICSQMHGFVAVNEDDQPQTAYISWQDERSLQSLNQEISTLEMLKKDLGVNYQAITGMRFKPGLPFVNLVDLLRHEQLSTKNLRLVTLPEWLIASTGNSKRVNHSTLALGLGFYDIESLKPSEKLVKYIKELYGVDLVFDPIVTAGSVAGYIKIDEKDVPVYVPVGDHQCALLGAGYGADSGVSLNIGTGSQVSVINKLLDNDRIERRPYFDGEILSTVTHLPAGRALACYVNFISGLISELTGEETNLWNKLHALTEEEVLCSDLVIDLAVFTSAWNYHEGGKIDNITEGNLNLKNYLASLLRCLVLQYVEVVKLMGGTNKVVISGGVARRNVAIAGLIRHFLHCDTTISKKVDETLWGLKVIMVIIESKSEINYGQAQRQVGL